MIDRLKLAVLAGVIPLSGCATALSSFQPAHVPDKGHFQAELGADLSISGGSLSSIVLASQTFDHAATQRTLTDDEKLAILEGGGNLAVNPPAVIPHLAVAYSPFEHWEIAARIAASGWRGGIRRQLLDQRTSGVDLTIGVGVGRSIVSPPIHSLLETLTVDEFTRWTLDVPIAIGQRGSWFRWWAGPRFVYAHTSETMTLTLPIDSVTVTGSMSGHAIYVGGYAGLAFGYRWIFLGPEITLVRLFGSADVSALGNTTNIDVGGLVFYPGLAIMGEF